MAWSSRARVKLLFFAKSRELCGCKEDHITVQSPTSFRNLLNTLTNKYNSLSTISGNLILALNQEYLERDSENINLNAGDEIAVIPPISGG
ncbi:molybdopterin synthase sulfur carrier subunit-like [Liolophura sinensis]|uniref:molybdopterin synthase sulfur carrier subunit-like n=1 Tax=Liolophura sinensis TaxID=3198878 RepID=UPI0031594104